MTMTAVQVTPLFNISEEELEKNSKFSLLLEWLSDKITPAGVSQHIWRKLDLAKHNEFQARYNWLMNSIIYNETGELLADLEIHAKEGNLSLDEKQFKHVLSKTLAFSEIDDYVHQVPSSATMSTLFGLSGQDVDRHTHVKHHLKAVHQITVPRLEDKLRRKCEELYHYLEPRNNQEAISDSLLVAKSQSLPVLVEQKRDDLAQREEKLKQDRLRRDKLFWSYYQKLLECLSVMEILMKEFKLHTQAEVDRTSVDWLKARSDALCLKVRLTQLQILCDLYTKETVKALKKIRTHLDTTLEQTERELASTTHSLETYHSVGTEFKAVVREFTQLQFEIENRKWGLQKLAGDDKANTLAGAVGGASSSSSKTSEILERAINEVGKANNREGGLSFESTSFLSHQREDSKKTPKDQACPNKEKMRQTNTISFDQLFDS